MPAAGKRQLVNLAAAAAAHALGQPGVARVAIIDIDVHHGNGTESIFEANPDVLYISTHQEGLWPYTGDGKALSGNDVTLPLCCCEHKFGL